jgi:hypothetical protein
MGRGSSKRKRKANVFELAMLPTDAQLANGDFDRDFVTHSETNTKAMTYRNRESSILEKWVREGGPGFEHGATRAIADCQTFWQRMGEQRVIARYGERIAASTHGNGYSQQEAADEIAHRKRMVPAPYWDVFENVIRHNEPAGVAGSRFASNTPQSIGAAKTIVGFVASVIAMKLGY